MYSRHFFAALLLSIAVSSAAPAQTTESLGALSIPSSQELKEGDVSKDATTSRAVEQILARCAQQYADAEYLYASGTFIQASKSTRRGETASDLHMELVYEAPNRLRIEQEGKDLHTVFVADGETVTQINHTAREFVKMPQPDDLAAFTEEEREGELADDETNGIANSVIANLLLTPDPLNWIHSNVLQYVYEGTEELTVKEGQNGRVRNVSCWRIKFVQDNPELVVINWIERGNFLLRKVSIIQAIDSDGDHTQSYKSAATARMRLSIFDSLSTNPAFAQKARWSVPVPKGYEPLQYGDDTAEAEEERESGWTRLVRAAVAEKGERTTATLSHYYGPELLKVTPFYEMDSRVTALNSGGEILGGPSLLAASVGKQVAIVRDRETSVSKFSVAEPIDQLQPLARPDSEPLIVAAQTESGKVRALTESGKTAWTYERPTPVASVATSRGAQPGRVYVAYQDSRGMRVLDGDGKVKRASRRVASLDSVVAAHEPGAALDLLAHGLDEMAWFNWELELTHRFSSEFIGGPAEIDHADAEYPIVMIRFSTSDDAVLQRIGRDDATSWSLILAPNATDLKGAAVDFARLRIPDRRQSRDGATTDTLAESAPQRCIFTLLSDGRITIATMTGDLVYRGQLSAHGTLANRRDQWRTFGLAIQDMNGDGEDEIYTALDAQIVQITTQSAEN